MKGITRRDFMKGVVIAVMVTLGPWLRIDWENEIFKDSEPANRLVRGFYRKPYIVPDLSV